MPLIDDNLELLPWFGQSTPDIAPCAPAASSVSEAPGKHPSMLLQSSGSADPTGKLYPGVLWSPGVAGKSVPRPIPPNTGNVTLAYDVWVSGQIRFLETDLIIVQNGLKFNGSLQRNLATGEIDIGGWTDTKLRLGEMRLNERFSVEITYSFTANGMLVASYTCYGFGSPIGITIPATPCDWLSGAYIQFQHAMFPAGNPCTSRFRNVRLIWS